MKLSVQSVKCQQCDLKDPLVDSLCPRNTKPNYEPAETESHGFQSAEVYR